MDSSFHTNSNVAWWNCGEDQPETALWSADTTGYHAPPAHDFDAGLGVPIASTDWNPAVAFVHPPYGNLEATALASAVAFDPTFTYSHTYPVSIIHAPTPSPTDGGGSMSSQSDAVWVPSSTQLVGEPHFDIISSTSAAPPAQYQPELAWFETPGQFIAATASCSVDDSNATRSIAPNPEFTSMPWGPPRSILGKRPRKDEETGGDQAGYDGHRLGQCKKAKGDITANGVLEAAGSTSRARQRPITRIPVEETDKSEAAGHGAGGLAAPNAQGVYRQLQPGPSAQGELMGATAQGQPQLVEGSEQGITWYYASSAAVQQPEAANNIQDKKQQEEEAEDAAKLIRLPRRLTQRHQALLKATSADWERGSIHERKCRLCPDAAFCNWEDFRRHCDAMEAHPLKIAFCEHCGDFFARGDSLARHRRNRPPECLGVVSLAEAEAKRRETEEAHREFEKKLQRYLESGEAIGTPFAQIIKEKFPKSSKRGSRQQSRIKGSWSRS